MWAIRTWPESLIEGQPRTLLIVGGDDLPVIEINRQAMAKLFCERLLAIVPGATHLFEEKGALEQVERLARDWLILHLAEQENKMLFRDRMDAGQRLGVHLQKFLKQDAEPGQMLVLGLPRGGVPVAFEVALALNAPLDIFVVRKLGAPGHEELAMGAIASGGIRELNADVVDALRITLSQIEETTAREALELERREQLYRGDRPPLEVSGKSIVLVDDGLATGYTMRAAVAALRQQGPKQIVVAVPVAARSTCEKLEREADAAVCLNTPFEFMAVGQWYRNFEQVSDEEVRSLLNRQLEARNNALPVDGRHLAS